MSSYSVGVCVLLIALLWTGGWIGPDVAAAESSKKAFFLSLAVPGAGQYYLGEMTWARRFLIAEAVLWLSYAGFRTYEEWRERDYELFAAQHAGVQPSGKDEEFFDRVGFYTSVYEYNRITRWEDGVDARVYPEQPVPAWEWEHEEARVRFRAIRSSSIAAHRRALYVLGGVIVNHVLSGIQAAQAAGDRDDTSGSNWRLEPLHGLGVGVRMVVHRM